MVRLARLLDELVGKTNGNKFNCFWDFQFSFLVIGRNAVTVPLGVVGQNWLLFIYWSVLTMANESNCDKVGSNGFFLTLIVYLRVLVFDIKTLLDLIVEPRSQVMSPPFRQNRLPSELCQKIPLN